MKKNKWKYIKWFPTLSTSSVVAYGIITSNNDWGAYLTVFTFAILFWLAGFCVGSPTKEGK